MAGDRVVFFFSLSLLQCDKHAILALGREMGWFALPQSTSNCQPCGKLSLASSLLAARFRARVLRAAQDVTYFELLRQSQSRKVMPIGDGSQVARRAKRRIANVLNFEEDTMQTDTGSGEKMNWAEVARSWGFPEEIGTHRRIAKMGGPCFTSAALRCVAVAQHRGKRAI